MFQNTTLTTVDRPGRISVDVFENLLVTSVSALARPGKTCRRGRDVELSHASPVSFGANFVVWDKSGDQP